MSLRAACVLCSVLAAPALEAAQPSNQAASFSTARPQDREIWITLATDEWAEVEKAEGIERAAGLMTAYESRNGVTLALTRESQLGDIAAAMHRRFHRCGGFIAHNDRDQALDALDAEGAAPRGPAVSYTIDNGPVVQALMAQVAPANVAATITMLSSYLNRYYDQSPTAVQAANALKTQWQGYATGRSDVKVELFPHTWSQPSVIATIFGTTFPKEVVVIGGHLDSINVSVPSSQRPTALAPGADDDASGVASLTEAFRVAMATGFRPQRTVKFMAYAGEETGLRGSADIAQRFVGTAKMQVIGVLQLDMTNYKRVSPPATVDMGVLSDTNWTNSAQNQFMRDLINTYLVPSGITWQNTTCGYACSDHASWNNRGFPASLVFESLFGQHDPNLHTVNDTLANADPTGAHGAKFAKVAAAYMAELAKGSLSPAAARAYSRAASRARRR